MLSYSIIIFLKFLHLQALEHLEYCTIAKITSQPDLGDALPLVARGKVRDLYEVDPQTLLFVASDRISAYDVIMKNVCTL